jgi:hypothetical protein
VRGNCPAGVTVASFGLALLLCQERLPFERGVDGACELSFQAADWTVVVHPKPVTYQLFEGSYFSMEYPTTWIRDTSEASKGGYLDTTIHSDENSDVLTRVDVTPNSSAGAAASVNQMEQALSGIPADQTHADYFSGVFRRRVGVRRERAWTVATQGRCRS